MTHIGTKIMCSRCGKQDGHNAQSCREIIDGKPREILPRSRCDHAAVDAKREGLPLTVVAKRYGMTPQAVQFGWRRMFGDEPTPVTARRNEMRAKVLALAAAGMKGKQIAEAIGISDTTVYHAASRAGVPMRKKLDYSLGIEMMRRGSTVAEASAAIGTSQSALQRAARDVGVKSTRDSLGTRDGRSRRAATLIMGGMQTGMACMLERCSVNGALTTLNRMRRSAQAPTIVAAGTPSDDVTGSES